MSRWLQFAILFALLAHAQNPNWKEKLGADPIFSSTIDRYLAAVPALIKQLPDPTKAPMRDTWQPTADTCAALVNVYRLSGDTAYRDEARKIGDWLIQSNDYLVGHRDPALPYLGWGPATREGYFKCANVTGYHADDLWDTASVVRCLLKLAEIETDPVKSPYFLHAKQIVNAWPYVDRTLDDGPYATSGLRWYQKSNEACENRYVKNTNIAMGEQLFRIYRMTGDAADLDRAVKTLYTQIWDILVRHNLAYTSYMTYLDRSDDYAAQVAHNERKVVHSKSGEIVCAEKDSSCWNHLGYEGYAMFNIQQLTRDIPAAKFPVATTKDDIVRTIQVTMDAWRKSRFADTRRFNWSGKESTTHITAYNCAQRFSADVFDKECRNALQHTRASATVFYSLVPESLFRNTASAQTGSDAQD